MVRQDVSDTSPDTISNLDCCDLRYVPHAGGVVHQPFLVLAHGQRRHEGPQFARLEKKRGIPGPVGTPCRYELQMPVSEGFVHEPAAWPQCVRERPEHRSVEKADAYERVDRLGREREQAHVGGDREKGVLTPSRGLERAGNEVHYHDRTAGLRQRYRVSPGATRDVDDERVGRQREAMADHPRRWNPVVLRTTLRIAPFPVCAIVARSGVQAHR